jgi:protein ImuA
MPPHIPDPPRPASAASGASADLFPADPGDGGWAGFVLASLPAAGRILWIQDRASRRKAGGPGWLPAPARVIEVALSHPRDALIAAEEGLASAGIAGVVTEIWGDPPVLDFTATKRLAFRAARHGTASWLVRHAGAAAASASRNRWRVASLPALPDPDDPRAPGAPRWRAELFRSRDARPGIWVASHDPAGGLRFAPEPGDREMGEALPPARRSAAR